MYMVASLVAIVARLRTSFISIIVEVIVIVIVIITSKII